MDMLTRCPHCKTVCKTDAVNANRAVSCEKCGEVFVAIAANAVAKSAGTRARRANAAAKQQGDKPNRQTDVHAVADLNLDLVKILPGTFRQGSEAGYPDEAPVRDVELNTPFWLSRFPITQAQYFELMDTNPSFFPGLELPVESVTWYDALEFCHRLTEREQVSGRIGPRSFFRLPTEAEWEYACRTTPEGTDAAANGNGVPHWPEYAFGNDPEQLPDYGWFLDNSHATTHPVGEKKLNAWQLGDLHGNVAEWCHDWYARYEEAAATNPTGPEQGGRKVRRGGCYASSARRCRATDRLGVSPDCACALLGFRVAMVAVGTPPFPLRECRIW
jgi:formylglycine-generating enzyme required for sulfatase activity